MKANRCFNLLHWKKYDMEPSWVKKHWMNVVQESLTSPTQVNTDPAA